MGTEVLIKILKNYKDLAKLKYGIISLGIFGSYARGENTNDSDLDICIETSTPDPFIMIHVKEDIEALLNIKVDIVRLRDKMNPFFKNRIMSEMIYV